MTPVLVGLLLAIGLALAVVGVVAYPHLREGARLLTPEGERLAREARQKAQALAGSAADALINRERPAVEDDGADEGGREVRRGVRPAPAGAAPTPPPPTAPPPSASGLSVSGLSVSGPPASGPAVSPVPPGHGRPGTSASGGDPSRGTNTRVTWATPPPQVRPDGATPPPGTAKLSDRGPGPGRPPAR